MYRWDWACTFLDESVSLLLLALNLGCTPLHERFSALIDFAMCRYHPHYFCAHLIKVSAICARLIFECQKIFTDLQIFIVDISLVWDWPENKTTHTHADTELNWMVAPICDFSYMDSPWLVGLGPDFQAKIQIVARSDPQEYKLGPRASICSGSTC